MNNYITLDENKLKKLKKYFNKLPNVKFAAIVGSIATKGYSFHDIDIVVKINTHDKYTWFLKIIDDIADILNVKPEAIDIIDADKLDLEFKRKVLQTAIILTDRNFLKELINEITRLYPQYYEYQTLSIREWLNSKDPSEIDLNVIKRRLDFIKSEIQFLKQYVLSKNVEEIKTSPILKRLLERSYQLIIEAIIDTCRHIVSAKGWGPAYQASDFIKKCYEHSVINSEIHNYFTKAIKLRNVIVHRYLDIDYDVLYEEAKKLINNAKEFEKQIVNYLKKKSRNPPIN